METSNPSVLSGDPFSFDIAPEGVVRIAFGASKVDVTLEAAYELQYRLAVFLAAIEAGEYDEPGPICTVHRLRPVRRDS